MGTEPKPTADSTDDMRTQIRAGAAKTGPTFFKLKARLPVQGRADTLMAASDTISVVLKTYAKAGENGLHRHPNEDHVFVVLQGEAVFHGPDGEVRRVSKHEGVLVPHTALYWFQASDEEPLVMLRIGADRKTGHDVLDRYDKDGRLIDGFSDANKETELVFGDELFG